MVARRCSSDRREQEMSTAVIAMHKMIFAQETAAAEHEPWRHVADAF